MAADRGAFLAAPIPRTRTEDPAPSSPAIRGTKKDFCLPDFLARYFSTSASSIFIALTEQKEYCSLSDSWGFPCLGLAPNPNLALLPGSR